MLFCVIPSQLQATRGRKARGTTSLLGGVSMGFFASLGKKRVSEAEAAGAFVLANVKRAEEVWPKVAKGVNATFGTSLPFDRNAVCQFALAILALEMEALPRLFPADQATRIREHVYTCVSGPYSGPGAREGLQEYHYIWMQAREEGKDAMDVLTRTLLDRLGVAVTTASWSNELSESWSLEYQLSMVLIRSGAVSWKDITSKYRITP